MATPAFKNILIPIIVTVLILAVLEAVSRLVLSRVYDRRFDSSLVEDHKYGSSSGLKANASGMVWGKPFHTDEMGGRKHQKNKAGKPKLLVIGDSVTEGVGVDDTATFANIANELLDSFDVRNISLIGWSVSDYRHVADRQIPRDTSIRAVAIFYCLNDIYGKSAVKDLPAIANKGFVSRLNGLLQERCALYKLIKLYAYQNSDHYYRYDRALYLDSMKVKSAMADLVHIKAVCDSAKVDLTVFIVPYRSQLGNTDDLPQRVLADELRKNDIPYNDLLPNMKHQGDAKDLYLFGDEIHLSALGHRSIINSVYQK